VDAIRMRKSFAPKLRCEGHGLRMGGFGFSPHPMGEL
jgi:hypothetical protein